MNELISKFEEAINKIDSCIDDCTQETADAISEAYNLIDEVKIDKEQNVCDYNYKCIEGHHGRFHVYKCEYEVVDGHCLKESEVLRFYKTFESQEDLYNLSGTFIKWGYDMGNGTIQTVVSCENWNPAMVRP